MDTNRTVRAAAIVLLTGLAALAVALFVASRSHGQFSLRLHVGERTFRVAVADTPALRIRGLSDVGSLLPDEGMLFVFEHSDYHRFWMKDMRFPIDIVWISDDRHIVGVTRNVSPDSYPQPFAPPLPVRYVLEVPAGAAAFLADDATILPKW